VGVLCLASTWATYFNVEEPIQDSYLVVFRKGTPDEAVLGHEAFAAKQHVAISSRFAMGDFKGYAATIPQKKAVSVIEALPEVAWVQEDGVVRIMSDSAACLNQSGATWGIVRTSQQKPNPADAYRWLDSADGSGVTIYVFDTGIYLQHSEFGGRAVWGTNTVDNTTTDGNGHGTHVAGTAGGKTYGMAKSAKLVAVKVLSDSGSGAISQVIAGINWAVSNKAGPAVGSMSLGGGKNPTLDAAIKASFEKGLAMLVPAGGSNGDACNFSPSGSPDAITIAASDDADNRFVSSNWGKCVSMYAPGFRITSAWIGRPDAISTLTGTSTAVPHVAGEAAKFLQATPSASPIEVRAFLENHALKGVIVDGGFKDTPNLLLFADCSSFP